MAGLARDLRSAWRFLTAQPGWTAIAVVSLALGIGANTVVFSLVETVLLRPFPYRDPDEIVLMRGSREFEVARGLSIPDIEAYDSASGLVGAAFYLPTTTASPEDEPEVSFSRVGDNLFDVLGVRPILGREFEPSDTQTAVVLSYGFWQSRYGGDPGIVGETLRVNNSPLEILGVMPQGFFFPEHDVEFWTSLPLSDSIRNSRTTTAFRGVSRLRTSLERAQAEVDVINRQLDEAYPGNTPDRGRVTHLLPIHEAALADYSTILWMLLGAVGLVLLIACANVANLLLARTIARQKELALRAAIGAGRGALVRQVLIESLLLSAISGLTGLAAAYAGIQGILALGLVEIPRIAEASINLTVLSFALAVAGATGILAGLLPAWNASRVDLNGAIKQGGQTSSQSSDSRLRDTLVVVEVALALVLLVGAGLLVRSSVGLSRIEWGFDPEGLSVVSIRTLSGTPIQQTEFAETVLDRLRRIPEIQAVSIGGLVPLVSGNSASNHIVVDGSPISTAISVQKIVVTRGYFRALGIPVTGRGFGDGDDMRGQRVAVLSQSLADQLFPDGNGVGKVVHFPTRREGTAITSIAELLGSGNIADFEISETSAHLVVGVAGDVKLSGDPGQGPAGPTAYVDYRQAGADSPSDSALAMAILSSRTGPRGIVVRSAAPPGQIVETVKRTLLGMDPQITFREAAPMETLISRAIGGAGSNKLMLVLSLVFGTLSLMLAAAGIYGVMSHGVNQRRYEFGVRMAIGAEPGRILALVLRRGLMLAGAGIALGVGGAWSSSRLLESMLFGITTTDVMTYAGVTVFLLAVAVAASLVPARRASQVDPLIVTRSG